MKAESAGGPARPPHNRLGLDYRYPPPRRVAGPILDIHAHVHAGPCARAFFEAADAYGVARVVSMSPLKDLDELRREFGPRLDFIAIPDWKKQRATEEFRASWIADLSAFRAAGARLCKFWMAPLMRKEHGLTVDHAFLSPVVRHALALGFDFMIHVADPSVWWRPGGKYAQDARVGAKRNQYRQLEWLLRTARPRFVIAAHMGGSIEDLPWLQELLDRHDNLLLDTSATKWIVREAAPQPDAVREFMIRNQARVLFGSDLVARPGLDDFDHYASRYWAHQTLWETAYRGESPIDDPDAPGAPQLAGVDLPDETLRAIYRENARRLGFAIA